MSPEIWSTNKENKMAKTLVEAKHPGRGINSLGGCYTRWSNDGLCSGVKTAEWLNSLGEDEARYAGNTTNGDVRNNWLRGSDHIQVVRS